VGGFVGVWPPLRVWRLRATRTRGVWVPPPDRRGRCGCSPETGCPRGATARASVSVPGQVTSGRRVVGHRAPPPAPDLHAVVGAGQEGRIVAGLLATRPPGPEDGVSEGAAERSGDAVCGRSPPGPAPGGSARWTGEVVAWCVADTLLRPPVVDESRPPDGVLLSGTEMGTASAHLLGVLVPGASDWLGGRSVGFLVRRARPVIQAWWSGAAGLGA
jgi:hypothetical protein